MDSAVAQMIILLVVALAVGSVIAVLLVIFAGGPAPVLLRQATWSAVYSALAAPLVFAALSPFSRLLGLRVRRSFSRA